jgi:hypothetical protein
VPLATASSQFGAATVPVHTAPEVDDALKAQIDEKKIGRFEQEIRRVRI